jgi:hypothetical protein
MISWAAALPLCLLMALPGCHPPDGTEEGEAPVAKWCPSGRMGFANPVGYMAFTGTIEVTSDGWYNEGWYPESISAADMNGDGKPDLLVIGESDTVAAHSNHVGVLLNRGDGTFDPVVNVGIQARAMSVAAADLDGDGNIDLAVATGGDADSPGYLAVSLNQGNATFADVVKYAMTGVPESVAAADLNGDGKPDLAVLYGGGVAVFVNHGDGTFAPAIDHGTPNLSSGGRGAQAIAVADVDRDGKLDLAYLDDESMNVLTNHGDGTFLDAVRYDVGRAPWSITAADVNGDGWPDLAVASEGVRVHLNQGDGTFASADPYLATDDGADWVTAADLNGDGGIDLIATSRWSAYATNLGVLYNQGDDTFGDAVHYVSGAGASAVVAADLNGDGKLDLAVANFLENTVSVLLNVCLP